MALKNELCRLLFLVIIGSLITSGRLVMALDPEINMDVQQLITTNGYPFEQHDVVTDDGYILTMHRIPGQRSPKSLSFVDQQELDPNRPVILLMHGLMCDSSLWLLNLPDQNLPYLLADKGADVWLGNNRGTRYSRRHKTLSPDSQEFWDFSWDELSLLDLPAMVTYVLNTTKAESIFYLGHSEGTLIAFAGFPRLKPSSNVIKRFYALAPVATVGYILSPIRVFAPYPRVVLRLFGSKDFLADPHGIFKILAKTLCQFPPTNPLCENIIFVLTGSDGANMNTSRIPVYISHIPSSTSVENIVHFAQMVKSKLFQMYDYGSSALNQKHYNQTTPPIYDLKQMTVPTILYTGGADWLADPRDVLQLISALPHVLDVVSVDRYDHLDFVWGIDANHLIFNHVIHDIWQQANITMRQNLSISPMNAK